MAINVTCPKCGQHYEADDDSAGMTLECRRCGASFRIKEIKKANKEPRQSQGTNEYDFTTMCPYCQTRFSHHGAPTDQAICPRCGKSITTTDASFANVPYICEDPKVQITNIDIPMAQIWRLAWRFGSAFFLVTFLWSLLAGAIIFALNK